MQLPRVLGPEFNIGSRAPFCGMCEVSSFLKVSIQALERQLKDIEEEIRIEEAEESRARRSRQPRPGQAQSVQSQNSVQDLRHAGPGNCCC